MLLAKLESFADKKILNIKHMRYKSNAHTFIHVNAVYKVCNRKKEKKMKLIYKIVVLDDCYFKIILLNTTNICDHKNLYLQILRCLFFLNTALFDIRNLFSFRIESLLLN